MRDEGAQLATQEIAQATRVEPDQILTELCRLIDPAEAHSWFGEAILQLSPLRLVVPTRMHAKRIAKHYGALLERLAGEPVRVESEEGP